METSVRIETKRAILKFLASIYDPLGIASPVTLLGKFLYREACDLKVNWDEKLPNDLCARFQKWRSRLPSLISVPRSIPLFREGLKFFDFHVFGDASKEGVSAVLYVVAYQASGTTQGLLASKSRLSKKGYTIPRLELIACHMAANLLSNARHVKISLN